ncbi:MAG: hypothetical protein D6785_11460, partial [Planctomycetota bacterium]
MAFTSTYERGKKDSLFFIIHWSPFFPSSSKQGKTLFHSLLNQCSEIAHSHSGKLVLDYGSLWLFSFALQPPFFRLSDCLDGALEIKDLAEKEELSCKIFIFPGIIYHGKEEKEGPASLLEALEKGKRYLKKVPEDSIGVETSLVLEESLKKFYFIKTKTTFLLKGKKKDPTSLGYRQWIFQKPEMESLLDHLQKLMTGSIKGILLEGEKGEGKTYFLSKISQLAESLGAKIYPLV